MVTTVRGAFKEFSGDAVVNTENPAASKVTVAIKAGSIDTGVADRDARLIQSMYQGQDLAPVVVYVQGHDADLPMDGPQARTLAALLVAAADAWDAVQ